MLIVMRSGSCRGGIGGLHGVARVLCGTLLLLGGTSSALGVQADGVATGKVSADGFVTKIDSPTEFELGTLHVAMDGKTECSTERLDSAIELKEKTHAAILAHRYIGLQDRLVVSSTQSARCDGLSLVVGSRVHLIGDVKGSEGLFFATQMVLYSVKIVQSNPEFKLEGGALLEEKAQVSRTAQGWSGTLWLDGYPMSITPDTTLLTAPAGTQISYKPVGLFASPRMGAVLAPSPLPKASAGLWQPNTWATYRGAGKADCNVWLYRVRLWPNQIDTREQEFWAKLTPAIQVPDYLNHAPGTVSFSHASKGGIFRILPDQDVQNFVSRLGTTLIPPYQRDLPETDATKIHFRFYVVQPAGAAFDDEVRRSDDLSRLLRASWDEGVVALPNGLIFVPETMLARIENEAELAAIFSHAITSVLQKHRYITQHSDPYPCAMFCSDDPYGGYDFALQLNEQSLRIGIREMYLAGYDLREAPFAWAVAQGIAVHHPVVDSREPDKEIPWYAAYAFDYISQYYKDVDYSKLKRGEAEYREFLGVLRKAGPEAFAGKK